MTRSEAFRYIRDKADQALNEELVTYPVRAWAAEVHSMLFVFDEAPADEIVAAIFELGYVRGMEMILHYCGLKPFVELKSVSDSAVAWNELKNAFLQKCEREKYGLE